MVEIYKTFKKKTWDRYSRLTMLHQDTMSQHQKHNLYPKIWSDSVIPLPLNEQFAPENRRFHATKKERMVFFLERSCSRRNLLLNFSPKHQFSKVGPWNLPSWWFQHVSTHLENDSSKSNHFPKFIGEKTTNLWNHRLETSFCLPNPMDLTQPKGLLFVWQNFPEN